MFARSSSRLAVRNITAAMLTAISVNMFKRESLPNTSTPSPYTTLESKTGALHLFGARFYPTDKKHWPKPSTIARTTYRRINRGRNLIERTEDEPRAAQGIMILGTKEHSNGVEKYFNEDFYFHLLHALGALSCLSFGVASIRIQKDSIFTIAELKDIFFRKSQQHTPCSYQLLTSASDSDKSAKMEKRVRISIINKPFMQHDMATKILQESNRLDRIIVTWCVDLLCEHFAIKEVDFRILMAYGKLPPGFETCAQEEEYEKLKENLRHEPKLDEGQPLFNFTTMKAPLRPNAPFPHYAFQVAYVNVPQSQKLRNCPKINFKPVTPIRSHTHRPYDPYHGPQIAMVEILQQRMANGQLAQSDEADIPEPMDYFSKTKHYMAYRHEYLRRWAGTATAEEIQAFSEQNPRTVEEYYENQNDVLVYWTENPGEMERCFPSAAMDGGGLADDSAVVRVAANGSTVTESATGGTVGESIPHVVYANNGHQSYTYAPGYYQHMVYQYEQPQGYPYGSQYYQPQYAQQQSASYHNQGPYYGHPHASYYVNRTHQPQYSQTQAGPYYQPTYPPSQP